jgi:hypothetical protein
MIDINIEYEDKTIPFTVSVISTVEMLTNRVEKVFKISNSKLMHYGETLIE